MSLYTKTYWSNINKILNKVLLNDIVEFFIISKFYICLERFRFDTYSYLMTIIHKPLANTKYVHPLILLGVTLDKKKWSERMDKMLLTMSYEKLVKIGKSVSPFHLLHYYYWKTKGFPSTCYIERETVNTKSMWNLEEIKEYERGDMVTMVIQSEEKKPEVVKGYVSFDDIVFEGRRRYIGLTPVVPNGKLESKSQIEVFDTLSFPHGNFTFYVEKNINDNFITKQNGVSYHFNLNNEILPWDIQNNQLVSMTYGIYKRKIKHFRLIDRIDNDFTKCVIRDGIGDEKKINLTDYKYPKFYEIKENIVSYSEDFVQVICTLLPINKNGYMVRYELIFENNNLVTEIIPKLIESTILGYLGEELIIENDNVSIISQQNKNSFINKIQNVTGKARLNIVENKPDHITIIFS